MKLILSDKFLDIPKDLCPETEVIDLSQMKIASCLGCFGCWIKTPGRCVIRDDAVRVYPLIAKSQKIIYVSKVKYGGYGQVMKTMLERSIPVQKAFIHLSQGETHHVQRDVAMKEALIIAYGCQDAQEMALFERLAERNKRNMSFESARVVFAREEELEALVLKEVAKWAQ